MYHKGTEGTSLPSSESSIIESAEKSDKRQRRTGENSYKWINVQAHRMCSHTE